MLLRSWIPSARILKNALDGGRMLDWDGDIWLCFSELTGLGIEENTLKVGILRKSPIWFAIPDPSDRRKRLIRYSSMSPKYKALVKSTLCAGLEPKEWLDMKRHEAEFGAKLQQRDNLDWLLEDMCEDGYKRLSFHYPGVEGRTLRYICRAAGILKTTVEWYEANGIDWKSYGPVKDVIQWMGAHPDYFAKKYLPENQTRLMEKVRQYGKDKLPLNEVVKLPRQGNTNRATAKKDMWWQAVVIRLRTSGANYSQRAIYRRLGDVAALEAREIPSESTVMNFLRDTVTLTVAQHTDLNNKKRQPHRASMPIIKAINADACWEMDGTKVPIAPHLTGGKTKAGKKEVKNISVVAVRDVYSGAWLGYWFGYAESEHSYREALKMAVEVTGRLPYELRHDRFPGHNTETWEHLTQSLERHGVKMSKTSASTGKASVERAFRTYQDVFVSGRSTWTGQGIKSTLSNARPTEMYIARMMKKQLSEGWNYDAAWMEAADIMAEMNHTAYSVYSKAHPNLHVSPWEMYEQAAGDSEGRELDILGRSELFWHSRTVQVANNMIMFSDRGDKHVYRIDPENYDLIRRYQGSGKKVVVRHDRAEFSTVMVFSESGEFLAELRETPGVSTYGKNADWEAVSEWKESAKAIEAKKAKELEQYELPAETASLMAMSISKERYNDAQTSYAFANAAGWVAEKQPKAPKKKEMIDVDNIDISALTRGQY